MKRNPQGGVYAQVIGRGRVWVESVNTITNTALVRFDPGEGMRSRVHKIALAALDFSTPDGWKVMKARSEGRGLEARQTAETE